MPKTRVKKIVRTTCALAVLGITPAYAMEKITTFVPNAQKVGEGRLTYLFWDVYDAALFAPDGQWNSDQPFALKLSYLRDITGEKIADRSIEEMRNQGFDDEVKLATWHTQMRDIFPDVGKGTSLTGVYTSDGAAVFYYNNEESGRINDAEFSALFFNIWLSPDTSAPDLRRKLLGRGA